MLSSEARDIYLGEIGFQARCALRAEASARSAHDAMWQEAASPGAGDHLSHLEETLRAVHSALTHASCISKMLWPIVPFQKRKTESKEEFAARRSFMDARGCELRQILNVDESSVLKERVVRDHLEHFDERLDERARAGRSGWILNNISSLNGMPFDKRDLLRWLDPSTGEFVIQGDTILIPRLVAELQRLLNTLPERHR